jgi:hypothetical protein
MIETLCDHILMQIIRPLDAKSLLNLCIASKCIHNAIGRNVLRMLYLQNYSLKLIENTFDFGIREYNFNNNFRITKSITPQIRGHFIRYKHTKSVYKIGYRLKLNNDLRIWASINYNDKISEIDLDLFGITETRNVYFNIGDYITIDIDFDSKKTRIDAYSEIKKMSPFCWAYDKIRKYTYITHTISCKLKRVTTLHING